jgi:hypothetical protein
VSIDLTAVLAAAAGAATGIMGAVAVMHRTRMEARTAAAAAARSDRQDVIAMLTDNVAYWREEARREREKAEAWQERYHSMATVAREGLEGLERTAAGTSPPRAGGPG